jgi:glycosyltransferase involved in cell wall biosynthesis
MTQATATPAPRAEKVSCLLVALADPRRRSFFRRSLEAYLAQRYANRELVVVLDQGPALGEYRRAIEELGRVDIRVHVPGSALSLGALRNASVAHARGDYWCQWDDDDIHHPDRIERQLGALLADAASACYLEDVLQFYPAEREMYWTNYARTAAHCHPATLLCRAGLPVQYPDSGPDPRMRSGEDDLFCRALRARHRVAVVRGRPELYVYVSHGLNAMGPEHHRFLTASLAVSPGRIARHEQALRSSLAELSLTPPAFTMMSRNGPVFRFDASV